MLPWGGFARPPLQAAGATRRRRLSSPVRLDARVERRHAARCDRARDRRQAADELGNVGRRSPASSISCRRSSSGCARTAARPALAPQADDRCRPCSRSRLRSAAVRDERRHDRRARARRGPRNRLLPSRRSTRACPTSSRTSCSATRTRSCRRWRTRPGRSARCSAACSRRRGARTRRTGSTPCRSSSPHCSSRGSPPGCCRASGRAHARPLDRSRGRLRGRVRRRVRCSQFSSRGASRRSGAARST